MNIDELKSLLERAKDDPNVLEPKRDEIDELLLGVIKIEKKHLYGLDLTSSSRRQEEIRKFMDENIQKILGH